MTRTRLDTPFLDGGVRSTNFFNGRLLSREDMQREQDAERAVHERLGRALGAGIAYGFEVEAKAIGGNSAADPVVTVHAGLAVNRRGQTVALDRDVDVSLLRPAAPASNGAPLIGGFGTCLPPDNTVYVTGTGVYLLSVAPASQKQGLAVVSGLNNTAAACNAKEVVEGVQFHLYQVKLTAAELADDAHLRNVAAYKFFIADSAGTDAARDPFGIAASPVTLTDPPLTDCDVPLALFQWTAAGGLRWVDRWSVRRRLAPVGDGPWSAFADPHRLRVGEAMFQQFQEQISQIAASGTPKFKAISLFRYLPPIGMIPIGPTDVDYLVFFGELNHRNPPAVIEGARLRSLVLSSFAFPSIGLGSGELIWLYFVRENMQSIADGNGGHPYLVFTSGHIPYQGDARHDVQRWNYSNFALPVTW